ncbi:tail assembly chaperone [Variovorax phage VarioGold]|uniref:phage tail assembly chaperone n=1 Tax=Variovorax sp. ZS18.2.2 TaxID=2971255 RepID=UPI0021515F7A|nr:phage tail assembly chaperone [Variovorax sp. ZS18.2.2]MCR6477525.1 phage tail assembly chaperone [Variovorax sp. ZS18.2.2]UYD72060.1 tail assembly chaperone [Variovorax phage VarioGold]
MPKIKLGSPPESFARTVTFKQLDGLEVQIKVTFRYRTREQYAAFMDDLYKAATGQASPPTGAEISAAAKEGIDRDVEHIFGALLAWDLDDELDRDSVRLLANEFPAAIAAITDDYRLAVTEGRAKN